MANFPPSLPPTQPLAQFSENPEAVFKELAASERPLVLMQNGQAAGVVKSPKAYEELAEAAELVHSIEQVQLGITQAKAGKSRSAAEVFAELEAKMRARPAAGYPK